ncbi:MAG: LD-carboxypeptidase, partial [Gemmatimonadota bacterium]|nr:LD-carboxypeptidase [Gemmatimonadota bacterium]
MSVPYTTPPALAPGARVALLAPAGPLASPADLERAERNVRELGWEPHVSPHALARDDYLAGDDASRLADLNAAIRDPRIDGIWCLRGGYGSMRILDTVDYDSLRRRPKAVIGFSDITALHLAIRARADLV